MPRGRTESGGDSSASEGSADDAVAMAEKEKKTDDAHRPFGQLGSFDHDSMEEGSKRLFLHASSLAALAEQVRGQRRRHRSRLDERAAHFPLPRTNPRLSRRSARAQEMDTEHHEETQEDMAVKLEERILESLFKIGGEHTLARSYQNSPRSCCSVEFLFNPPPPPLICGAARPFPVALLPGTCAQAHFSSWSRTCATSTRWSPSSGGSTASTSRWLLSLPSATATYM
jgi:hypothetical protein